VGTLVGDKQCLAQVSGMQSMWTFWSAVLLIYI
jgi:hypothetical protein